MRTVLLGFIASTVLGCSPAAGNGSHVPTGVPAASTVPVPDPRASAELDEAERTLEAVGSDCASACSALRRMNGARIKLCSPRTSGCDDAERREGDARKHVAAFCECPP